MIRGKLENQANLLRYIAPYRKEPEPELHDELMLPSLEVRDAVAELEQLSYRKRTEDRERLLSVEERAAQYFWVAIGKSIPVALS